MKPCTHDLRASLRTSVAVIILKSLYHARCSTGHDSTYRAGTTTQGGHDLQVRCTDGHDSTYRAENWEGLCLGPRSSRKNTVQKAGRAIAPAHVPANAMPSQQKNMHRAPLRCTDRSAQLMCTPLQTGAIGISCKATTTLRSKV